MAKSRSSNWHYEEVNVLITCLQNATHLITGEFIKGADSIQEVKKEWANIASFVNAVGFGVNRTGEQVKNKWLDLKYR